MEITYKANSYYIDRIEQETDEALSERAWFIIKLLDPSLGIDRKINVTEDNYCFDEAVLLSKYWYYMNKYDCKYSKELSDKIKKIEKNMYD